MKYNEMSPEQIQEHNSYITERWGQLSRLELEWSTDAIKYLLFVNAGSAAAVLTFIGAFKSVSGMMWPKFMLGLFVLGIFMVGLVQATRFHRVERLFKNWRQDTALFYSSKFDFEDITARDDTRSYSFNFAYLWAYAAFGCFIGGVLVGMCNFASLH